MRLSIQEPHKLVANILAQVGKDLDPPITQREDELLRRTAIIFIDILNELLGKLAEGPPNPRVILPDQDGRKRTQ